MMGAVFRGALSWPGLVAAAALGGTTLFAVAQVRGEADRLNAWDIAVPALANVPVFALIVAVLWLPVLAHRHRDLQRTEVLLRHGAWSRAVRRQLVDDLGRMSGAVVLCLVVVLAVASPLGISAGWSKHTIEVLAYGGLDTETSATAAASVVGQPWAFVGLQVVWALAGLLGYSALHVVALMVWGQRTAGVVLVVAGLYGVLVSSGVLGARPALDTSAGINFLWAATEPTALVRTLVFWAAAAGALCLVVRWRDRRQDLWSASPVAGISTVALAVAATWLFGLSEAGEGQTDVLGPLDMALSGQHSSLTGFIIAVLPMLTVAATVALRAAGDVTAGVEPVLCRLGTSGRWVWPRVARLCAASYGLAAVVVLGLFVLGAARGHDTVNLLGVAGSGAIVITVLTYGGLAVLVGGAGLGLVWWRGDGDLLPLVLLAVPVLSYPFFGKVMPLNPLSAFSREPGVPPTTTPLAVQTAFILILFLCLAVVTRRRTVPGTP